MEDEAMRTLLTGAAALALLTLPAAAQDNVKSGKTLDPIALSKQAENPPPKLSDKQIAAIRDGLAAVHTQQNMPKGFAAKPGAKVPKSLKIGALPQDLVRKDPAFRELGYAKTATDILVIDPMQKTVITVIPRKFAADPNAKPPTAAEWAGTRGRELTGQAPQDSAAPAAHQPAGDSGDVPNGDVNQAKPK
jgi:hypothetical protein